MVFSVNHLKRVWNKCFVNISLLFLFLSKKCKIMSVLLPLDVLQTLTTGRDSVAGWWRRKWVVRFLVPPLHLTIAVHNRHQAMLYSLFISPLRTIRPKCCHTTAFAWDFLRGYHSCLWRSPFWNVTKHKINHNLRIITSQKSILTYTFVWNVVKYIFQF